MSSQGIESLTPREREILVLIAEGDSLTEIAQKFNRSLKTIESHRLSIGRKLKVSNRVELAKIAYSSGLVSLETQTPEPQASETDETFLKWIRVVNNSIRQAIGRELLERFCNAASKLPGIDIAAICTCEPTEDDKQDSIYHRVIMAVSENGKLGESLRYHAMQTPCQQVIDQGSCCVPQGIQDFFPEDPWLKHVGADSYLGIQLTDAQGRQVGGIGLIGREPMDQLDSFRKLVEFFAPRLAGAIRVCREIELLRSQNDRLKSDLVAPSLNKGSNGDDLADHPLSIAQQKIADRIHPLVGAALLREITDAICEELGFYSAGVCKLDHGPVCARLHAISFCIDGKQEDPFKYEIPGTPCETAISDGEAINIDNVADAYPDDAFLVDHRIRSYCGIRLPSPTGETAGIMWLIDQKPLENAEVIKSLLQYYAPRIGAELNNFVQLELLQQERERLEQELQRRAKPRIKANS